MEKTIHLPHGGITVIKTNICGSKFNTPGQNLAAAIEGCDQAIGIPSYSYDKALEILSTALTTEEYDLVCRGFAFNYPRHTQKEIAQELGVPEFYVSKTIRNAIKKLQDSPYRVQLRALIPTVEELFREIETLRNETVNKKALKESQYRLEEAKAKLVATNEALKKAEMAQASVSFENEKLTKKLALSNATLAMMEKRVTELTFEAKREKARADAAKASYDLLVAAIRSSVAESSRSFAAKVKQAEAENDSFEALGFSEKEIYALRRINCTSLKQLLGMTPRMLKKMAVGAENLAGIQSKLEEHGFSLRKE